MSLSRRQSRSSSRGGTPDKRRQTIDPDELLALQNDLLNDTSIMSNDSQSRLSMRSSRPSNASSIKSLRKKMSSKSPRNSISSLDASSMQNADFSDMSFAKDNERRNTIDNNDLQWLSDEIGKENISQSCEESNTLAFSPSKDSVQGTVETSVSKSKAATPSTDSFSFGLTVGSSMEMKSASKIASFDASPAQNNNARRETMDARWLDSALDSSDASALQDASSTDASLSKSRSSTGRSRSSSRRQTMDAAVLEQELLRSDGSVQDISVLSVSADASATATASASAVGSATRRKSSSSSKKSHGNARRETIDPDWLQHALDDSSSRGDVGEEVTADAADLSLSQTRNSAQDLDLSQSSAKKQKNERRETMDAQWLDGELDGSSAMDQSRGTDTRRETLDAHWLDEELQKSNSTLDASVNVSVSVVHGDNKSTLEEEDRRRRETIDTVDRDWLMNEVCGLDESQQSLDQSSTSASALHLSRNSNRSTGSKQKKQKKSSSKRSPRPSVSQNDPDMETDNNMDNTDNMSVLTMNTMDVAQEMHHLLEQQEGEVSMMDDDHDVHDNQSVSEMSYGTVNTMDLMGAVQMAIDEEELNRSTNTDASSVIPLQDLLRRAPLSPAPLSNSSQSSKRNKRSARSPAADHTGQSPASRKLRIHSPAAASTASSNNGSEAEDVFRSPESTVSSVSRGSLSVGLAEVLSASQVAFHNFNNNNTNNNEPLVLRSCLSARKQRPPSASAHKYNSNNTGNNRSVVFGSPNVAEFHKHSPTTNFTPMDKREAKKLFSMEPARPSVTEEEVDEITSENERILEEWDRLTNASEGNSSDDDFSSHCDVDSADVRDRNNSVKQKFDPADKENQQSDSAARDSVSVSRSASQRSRRRLSKLQPLLELSDGMESCSASSHLDVSAASHTVQLPDTLADLIMQNDVSLSNLSHPQEVSQQHDLEASRTVDIEADLHDLLFKLDQNTDNNNNAKSSNTLARSTTLRCKSVDQSQLSASQEVSRTVDIEQDLQELMQRYGHTQSPGSELSQSRNSSGVLSEGYNPLQSVRHSFAPKNPHYTDTDDHANNVSGHSNVSGGSSSSDEGMMPLLTSSLVPMARLSVASFSASFNFNDSALSGDSQGAGLMQSIFGQRKPTNAVANHNNNVPGSTANNNNTSASHTPASTNTSVSVGHNMDQMMMDVDEDVDVSVFSAIVPQGDLQLLAPVNVTGTELSVLSDASTVQDPNTPAHANHIHAMNSSSSRQPELSFIEAKKRILFGSNFKNNHNNLSFSFSHNNNHNNHNHNHNNVSDIDYNTSNTASANNGNGLANNSHASSSLLLQRLQALKEGARQHSLAQCRTPGVPNKRQSLEFQRLSLAQHQASQQQHLHLQLLSANKRVSVLPSEAATVHIRNTATASTTSATKVLNESTTNEPTNELEEQETHSLIMDASLCLLPTNVSVRHNTNNSSMNTSGVNHSVLMAAAVEEEEEAATAESVFYENSSSSNNNHSLSMYREGEEVIFQLRQFFGVLCKVKSLLLTVDESLQQVVRQLAEDCFGLAVKGLVLGFEHLDPQTLFAPLWHNTDVNRSSVDYNAGQQQEEEEFVQQICDTLRDTPVSYSEDMATRAKLGCEGWTHMWTQLVATAIFELSEALQVHQQQLARNRHTTVNHGSNIFAAFQGRNKFLDKVLERRTQRLSLSNTSSATASSTFQFSRFGAVEDFLQSLVNGEGVSVRHSTNTDTSVLDTNADTNPVANRTKMADQTEAIRQELLNRVANRMSFVQVQAVFEHQLVVAVHLTEHVQLALQFNLVNQLVSAEGEEESYGLAIDTVDTRLIVANHPTQNSNNNNNNNAKNKHSEDSYDSEEDANESRVIAVAQDNAIAMAYFGQFMVSGNSILSETSLQRLTDNTEHNAVSHIPVFITQVAAHVTVLRKVLHFVRMLHLAGGLSMVSRQQGSDFSLNMDHIDLMDPIAVDLNVLVAAVQMPVVFRLLSEEAQQSQPQPGVVQALHLLDAAQKAKSA